MVAGESFRIENSDGVLGSIHNVFADFWQNGHILSKKNKANNNVTHAKFFIS